MSGYKPLLAVTRQPVRPLRDSLDSIDTGEAISPWTPRTQPEAVATAPMPMPTVSLEALEQQAREKGREAGLAETAELRGRLADAVARFEMMAAEMAAVTSAQIADAVVAVIATWTGHEDRARLFAPVIQAWATGPSGAASEQAVAHVHPGEVAALRDAIDDSSVDLKIVPDASVKPGNLVIRAAALELATQWDARLRDLREQIVAVLEHEQAGEGRTP